MAVKFLSDGHFSGSSTDLTLDGQLFLPSFSTTPGASPTISFDSGSGGISYRNSGGSSDQLWFRAGGSNMAYVNTAGIHSSGNLYTANAGDFRNYGGEWHATTGVTGNGFKFTNTADSVDALTLSATGNGVFAGGITASGNVQITGDTTSPHTDNAFLVLRGSDGSNALRVQNSGEVVVQNNYLYAAGTGTSLYVQANAVFRGNILNDTSGAPVTIADDLVVTGNAQAPKFIAAQGTTYANGYQLTRTGHDTYRICLGNSEGLRIVNETDSNREELAFNGAGNATFSGDVTAGSFIKSGGTSSQFLMADGSVSTGGSGISLTDADLRYVNVTGDTMTGNLDVNGSIIGDGNLFLRSYNNDPKGIFFRDGFEYGDTNQYNLSITIYDDGDGSADGMNINAYDGIYFNVQSGTTPSTAFRVLNGEVRSYKPLISDSSFQMNDSSTQVTMSGNTSGNFTLDNNTGSIAFQANGSTVNSMTITSSAITLNENTAVVGTFDPQGNILGAVIDNGNTANPLQVRRSAATTMQVGINFTVSPSSGSGFSRYLGVDASADLRFGSNTNHGNNALVLTTDNYVSEFGSFAGDIIPSADSTYDLGSNATKWAEGHFDHLYVGETANNPRIDIYTENATASIADTFTDTTTDKSYIYFQAGTNSNDPGFIMHETSESASPDERNEGVLHLVPSDDNGTGDYVSIHGTNDPDAIKLHTNGLIETANYQLVLKSAVGDVYIDDGLTVNGTIAATGGTSTTWNEAHDNMIISASVSGTSTKTLTLNQNDGGTVTASWTDLQGTTISTPNAPTNLSLSIVNNTINVTFDASSTSGIDQYLVFGSANGGDYSLISVIEPASMGSTMSVIDDSFDDSGTQAYRVYAMKTGVMSSVLSGSITYTVSTPVEPTNMSVVNLNTAFYIQWDPPSSNTRFVTAYNVYKHEHASQGSLSRSSATLIYSGMNTSYMYEISGNNNLSYHQFWVETTVT